jgi:hypothetical protein
VLGDPVDLVDPLGLLWGDETGEYALNYYINKELATGNKLWYIPAFFAALWTPETSTSTALTVFPYSRIVKPFAPALMKSECLGISSKFLGHSVATANKAPGILNKPGSMLKLGWSSTSSNGGGYALRLGIGKNGNKSLLHINIGGTFVPNHIGNPIVKGIRDGL